MRALKHEVEETKLRAIFASSPDAITVSDLNGNIADCNQATLVLHGYSSKEELIGKSAFQLIAKKDHKRAMENLKKTMEQDSVRNVEYTFLTKDGREFPAELSASVIKDSSGNPTGFVAITKDITEHKHMEEVLRKSEEKFRNIFEGVNDEILYLDNYGKIVDVNKRIEDIFGYKRDEVIEKNFAELGFLQPEDLPRMLNLFTDATRKGEIVPLMELELKDKKGNKVSVEASTRVIKKDGKIDGLLIIVRDITDRKKAEERIRESEEKYRVLVESAADAIFTLDEAGNFLSANQEAAKTLGKTPGEMIGKNMYDLFPKDIADLQMRKVKAVFQTGNPLLADETLTQTKLELRWYNTTLMPVRDSNGKIIYAMAISRDITERKKMEEKLMQYSEHLEELVQKRTEELLESEKRYSVLVEEASDGVVILQDGKIVFANKKAAQELVGYPREELIGLPFEKLVDEKYLQYAIERYKRRLRGEKVPAIYEVELIAKNGERVPVEISATLIRYQGRPADLIIVRDVSERKRMEEQRLKLEKLATVGELATMVGHDLRNPLQSIENATYYLNNELPRLPPSTPIPQKAIEMLQIINNSVNYADKIIRDLHDFSATKKPTLQKTNINTIVKEIPSQINAPENVKLITKLGHLPKIKADKDMIKRAFLNLAINGIQAMENGGTLKVSTKKTKDFIEISFKDTGTGISKQNKKKIFTPFFTTRAKGMGMGLAICKKFIDAHGGSIEVESEVDKGSTFTVKLPIQ